MPFEIREGNIVKIEALDLNDISNRELLAYLLQQNENPSYGIQEALDQLKQGVLENQEAKSYAVHILNYLPEDEIDELRVKNISFKSALFEFSGYDTLLDISVYLSENPDSQYYGKDPNKLSPYLSMALNYKRNISDGLFIEFSKLLSDSHLSESDLIGMKEAHNRLAHQAR